jgi:hypothetical protein
MKRSCSRYLAERDDRVTYYGNFEQAIHGHKCEDFIARYKKDEKHK